MIRETSLLKGRENAVKEGLQWIKEDAEDESSRDDHEYPQGEEAHAVIDLQCVVGQKVTQNAASVQRREGNQVEDEEQKIDQDDEVKQQRNRKQRRQILRRNPRIVHRQSHRRKDSGSSSRDRVLDDEQQDQRHRRQQKIADRAGDRNDNVVARIVFEIL